MKKIQIAKLGIYAVIDCSVCGNKSLAEIAKSCIKAGVKIIQLRDKTEDVWGFYRNAILIREITKGKALFIINDRSDIAKLVNADGLHIGQDDLPVEAVRRLLGPGKIIGKSCHSLAQAVAAEKEKADYISVGPIFSTPTKPDYPAVGLQLLKNVLSRVSLPVTAIGGIDKNNIGLVRGTGAKNIAVVRAICEARNIEKAIFDLGSYK
ncbi:MAG: thiamine phosphate synthase [Candidatus Omnitrophota bacterium]|nr:thiamine phosphate synthase [Candidatus Omnitrophota bacterium]